MYNLLIPKYVLRFTTRRLGQREMMQEVVKRFPKAPASPEGGYTLSAESAPLVCSDGVRTGRIGDVGRRRHRMGMVRRARGWGLRKGQPQLAPVRSASSPRHHRLCCECLRACPFPIKDTLPPVQALPANSWPGDSVMTKKKMSKYQINTKVI